MSKKDKTITMNVPAVLKRQIETLIRDHVPAKPIKRKEKFTVDDKKEIMRLLKAARPLFNRAVDEWDRYEEIGWDHLNLSDTKWLERYQERLGDIFNFINNELDASFYGC